MSRVVDLRSDTVTQPTAAMREAMAVALVGDDGYGEDPTVAALEARFATLTGKEAALFVPSGVMGNQIALRVLCAPGDVVVCGAHQHVFGFEMGAAARNAGVQFWTVEDGAGVFDLEEVAEALAAEADHQVAVRAIAVENTHMYAGGVPWPSVELAELAALAGERPLHLDGARLFNAVVATGESAATLCAPATTVMACLSKGLCAPVGSLLAGPRDLMERARIERKRLGGSLRQAGFLAAAGLVALDTRIERLAEDHRRARRLAEAFAEALPELGYDPATCRTNIVSFDHPEARRIVADLAGAGVLGGTVGPRRARFVTHHDVDDDGLEWAVAAVARLRV
ncbi:MAG: GntG family PLP-dependent aldolase [Acidimicrobiales bacterium]